MNPASGSTWFRFSISSILLAVVSIASLLGWFSAQRNYAKLSANLEKHSELIDAASVEAASSFDFTGIVGNSIDDYPLIQVLGKPRDVSATSVLEHRSIQLVKFTEYGIVDRFGNKREHWEKIDKNRMVTRFELLLKEEDFEGGILHIVTIFVQDSIIRLVTEVHETAAN